MTAISPDGLRIEPIHDAELIAQTMRHPRIYAHISDDGCPPREDFSVTPTEALLHLGVYEGEQFLGLFVVHPQNFVCYEVHTCLLPDAWGSRALAATRACMDWLFSNTPCRRIVTTVPAGNELALRLARRTGLTVYGINPSSLQRHGALLDQTLLGISKEV